MPARTAAVDSNDEAQMEAAIVRAREARGCWNAAKHNAVFQNGKRLLQLAKTSRDTEETNGLKPPKQETGAEIRPKLAFQLPSPSKNSCCAKTKCMTG